MIHTITVPRSNRPEEPSKVIIGHALSELAGLLEGKRPVIVTDSNIAEAYPELIEQYPHLVIGLGEKHKTLETVGYIYRQLLELGIDRGSFLVGIGGGIVTDITGFAASTYMRGVAGFGFVATSLLAQVDASVGGKNGVNLDGYKNIVGVFNQPDFVICDQGMLATLPEREIRSGLAEVIKCGLIRDSELFGLFENHTFESFTGDVNLMHRAIVASVAMKAEVVAADETERGDRKLLNLGHTFAHAIEKCTDCYLHGEAVGIGLCIAARISSRLGMLAAPDLERIIAVVSAMGLPTTITTTNGIAPGRLIAAVASDKKREAEQIDFVLLEGIGKAVRRRMRLSELDTVAAEIL